MRRKINAFLLLALCVAWFSYPSFATTFQQSNQPFSQHGMIQNVQNYSSNPFWNPNAPYNQRMPTAVYATGPDVETIDCLRIVASLVTTQCATRNNCIGTQLSDIRPAIMLQLSRMPGHNYATACAGYIDTAFNDYVKTYGNAAPVGVVSFPDATSANPTANGSTFTSQLPGAQIPQWQQEYKEREQELQNLQAQNGAGGESIQRAAFPTTYADLSFSERMENERAGYMPFKDAKAYKTLNIESQEEFRNRQVEMQQRQDSYCQSHRAQYSNMVSDLATLKKCRADGKKFSECKLKGTY